MNIFVIREVWLTFVKYLLAGSELSEIVIFVLSTTDNSPNPGRSDTTAVRGTTTCLAFVILKRRAIHIFVNGK